jgi:hypothetical protein
VQAQERTGVLVIRAWVEGRELRARITHTRDIGGTTTAEGAAASVEEVLQAVEKWLRSFVGPE